jgi:hypothetical protein
VPRGHHKSKPFIDHVLGFYLVDGRIWFRNFQISHMRENKKPEPVLAEIGPRMVSRQDVHVHPVRSVSIAISPPLHLPAVVRVCVHGCCASLCGPPARTGPESHPPLCRLIRRPDIVGKPRICVAERHSGCRARPQGWQVRGAARSAARAGESPNAVMRMLVGR